MATTTRYYYAGTHPFGSNFVYDNMWTVFRFENKADRDKFVDDYNYDNNLWGRGGGADAITRKAAIKCTGPKVEAKPLADGNGEILETLESYYTEGYNFWR